MDKSQSLMNLHNNRAGRKVCDSLDRTLANLLNIMNDNGEEEATL